MNFETVQIHFLTELPVLLSTRNFARLTYPSARYGREENYSTTNQKWKLNTGDKHYKLTFFNTLTFSYASQHTFEKSDRSFLDNYVKTKVIRGLELR